MTKRTKQQADPELMRLIGNVSELWTALADGDVLQAEIWTARRCGVPSEMNVDEDKSDALFLGMAKQDGRQEGAALLRLLMLTGSPAIKRRARDALGELTARGVYPASWVTEAGKPEPVRASRVHDVFGDWEDVYVTYRYAKGEHTLIARLFLFDLPVVRLLELTETEPDLSVRGPFEAVQDISLADARARLEPALLRSETSYHALSPAFQALLPVARSRLRRLPAGDAASARLYSGDDRAALVRDFLASPHAAEAVTADEPSARMWAEILTAWSSRLPGLPPLQAGPLTLRQVLEVHVPCTYPVTAEQFEHMPDAVTAWARWSAAQRGLDEDHLLDGLPQALSSARWLYDNNRDAAEQRSYIADVVTAGADVAELRRVWDVRMIVVPPAEDREKRFSVQELDVHDPEARAAYLEAEFGGCSLDDSLGRDEFLGAVRQVAEELWHGKPEGSRARALALLEEDELDRHDIMHDLVRQALARRP
ncbi:MAG TPA: hypothetical protein VKU39_16705 [Streptosporangiaceae bacterium]|nr:hypothetical protein [Streptosporangiaceae bacterium]